MVDMATAFKKTVPFLYLTSNLLTCWQHWHGKIWTYCIFEHRLLTCWQIWQHKIQNQKCFTLNKGNQKNSWQDNGVWKITCPVFKKVVPCLYLTSKLLTCSQYVLTCKNRKLKCQNIACLLVDKFDRPKTITQHCLNIFSFFLYRHACWLVDKVNI